VQGHRSVLGAEEASRPVSLVEVHDDAVVDSSSTRCYQAIEAIHERGPRGPKATEVKTTPAVGLLSVCLSRGQDEASLPIRGRRVKVWGPAGGLKA